jgi:hypothetical protein
MPLPKVATDIGALPDRRIKAKPVASLSAAPPRSLHAQIRCPPPIARHPIPIVVLIAVGETLALAGRGGARESRETAIRLAQG